MGARADGEPIAAPDLSPQEKVDVAERRAVGPQVLHEAIREEGEAELARPASALVWSGLAAGLSMGLSLAAEGLLREHLPDAGWRPLVTKLGYTVGFLVVILGRQQLFTENTLTAVLPLLARRDATTLRALGRLWVLVLVANLLGAWVFAAAAAHTDAFEPATRAAFGAIGREAMEGSFVTLLVGAVYAGWLVALMVWVLPGAEPSRPIVIVVLAYLIGLGGFPHIIAGATEVFYVLTAGEEGAGAAARWLAATLLGNVAGGVMLVSVLNHAQVVAGRRAPHVERERAGQDES